MDIFGGGRPDPVGRQALADALACRDRLAAAPRDPGFPARVAATLAAWRARAGRRAAARRPPALAPRLDPAVPGGSRGGAS